MLKNLKLVKGILAATLVVSLMVPTFAFANEDGEVGSERKEIFKEMKERYSEVDHGKLLAVVEMYAEEDLEDWDSMFDERVELKEELASLRKELKELAGDKKAEKKEEIASYREELKAKIEAGEMTSEEAKEEIKSYIEELKGDYKEKKAEREDKKEIFEDRREERKELRKTLVEAVRENNADTINEILDELFEMYEQHTEWAKEKIEYLNERIAENQ
ncbi:hypothetical protein [Wukongibacter sp. M2B1]|uniref:hypothetical protein n=1 Tax=Wukongibacter sp. M2B1 TaxID=3088895 RepID=UPI003D7BE47E